MNELDNPQFLLNNKTFQTIYGRNLLHELNIIIPNDTLVVTMEDLWENFSIFFNKNLQVHFVKNLDINTLENVILSEWIALIAPVWHYLGVNIKGVGVDKNINSINQLN